MRVRDRIGIAAVAGLLLAVGTAGQLWGQDEERAEPGGRTGLGYDCNGANISLTDLEAAPYATSLPQSAQKAFPALTSVQDVAGYRVKSAEDGRVTIAKLMSAREGTAVGPWRTNFQLATIMSEYLGGSEAYGW